jgi:hypothetical protein
MMMGTQASATPSAINREGTQEACTCAGTTNNGNTPAEPASSSQAVPVAHGPVASPFVGMGGGSASSSAIAHGSIATPSPSSSMPKGASPINHGTNQQSSGAATPSGEVFSPFKGAASSSYTLPSVFVSGALAAVAAVLAL